MRFTVWEADSFIFAEQSKQQQCKLLQTHTVNDLSSVFYEISFELQQVNSSHKRGTTEALAFFPATNWLNDIDDFWNLQLSDAGITLLLLGTALANSLETGWWQPLM